MRKFETVMLTERLFQLVLPSLWFQMFLLAGEPSVYKWQTRYSIYINRYLPIYFILLNFINGLETISERKYTNLKIAYHVNNNKHIFLRATSTFSRVKGLYTV